MQISQIVWQKWFDPLGEDDHENYPDIEDVEDVEMLNTIRTHKMMILKIMVKQISLKDLQSYNDTNGHDSI